MAMELNVKTLYLIGGIVTVCSAGAAFLTWYLHREAPALRAWTAALLLTSLGALHRALTQILGVRAHSGWPPSPSP